MASKPSTTKAALQRALFGAAGAMIPDILLVYSKRWTMGELHFDPALFVIAVALYSMLAALVATIFPYRGKPTPWKALALGFTLPILLSALASGARGILLSPRGAAADATLLDALSLF